jgi:glycosyltransferase involved in cell wall biosynthesis
VEVHQILVGASPGDAVTNMALRLQQDLRRLGSSEIYAQHIDDRIADRVQRLEAFPARGSGRRAIVYHSSIGEPAVTQFLLRRPEPIVLCFHNMTPASYFLDTDPSFAMYLAWGCEELRLLSSQVCLSVAQSTFNAQALSEFGYSGVVVLPLGLEPDRLVDLPDDPEVLARAGTFADSRILVVSQLLPHKDIECVLQAFHLMETYLDVDASLVVAGAVRDQRYYHALQGFVHRYGVRNVQLLGTVSDRVLATCFRGASVYVSASQHEGLGVPALEAMAFGLPVVARRAGAVPETVGDAAVLMDAHDGPEVLAELMTTVLRDASLRERLIGAGATHVRGFNLDATHAEFIGLLERDL